MKRNGEMPDVLQEGLGPAMAFHGEACQHGLALALSSFVSDIVKRRDHVYSEVAKDSVLSALL